MIFAKTPREGKEKGKGYHSSGRAQQEEKAMFSADEDPSRHESPSERQPQAFPEHIGVARVCWITKLIRPRHKEAQHPEARPVSLR